MKKFNKNPTLNDEIFFKKKNPKGQKNKAQTHGSMPCLVFIFIFLNKRSSIPIFCWKKKVAYLCIELI
jgi:hypothetical protein